MKKYLGPLLTNQNSIHEEIKFRCKAGISCYSTQTLLSSRIFSNLTLKYVNNNIASCAIWLWNMVSYIKGGM